MPRKVKPTRKPTREEVRAVVREVLDELKWRPFIRLDGRGRVFGQRQAKP
jgi:hypothetical protein